MKRQVIYQKVVTKRAVIDLVGEFHEKIEVISSEIQGFLGKLDLGIFREISSFRYPTEASKPVLGNSEIGISDSIRSNWRYVADIL